jgi:hypothetical protein
MNCQNCKNPIQNNSTECEWCGSEIIFEPNNSFSPNGQSISILRFSFKGAWLFVTTSKIDIYSDGKFIDTGIVLNGFVFEHTRNSNTNPVISFKSLISNVTLTLPQLELNKSYLIELEYSRKTGNIASNPLSIVEIANPTQKNNYNKSPTGSFIDDSGNYTCGGDVYFQVLLEKLSSDFENSEYIIKNIEHECPNCTILGVHFCYGKYQCGACGHNYIYNK